MDFHSYKFQCQIMTFVNFQRFIEFVTLLSTSVFTLRSLLTLVRLNSCDLLLKYLFFLQSISYTNKQLFIVPMEGFKPSTYILEVYCSIQLSYMRINSYKIIRILCTDSRIRAYNILLMRKTFYQLNYIGKLGGLFA